MAASKKVISHEAFMKKLDLKFLGSLSFEVISEYTHNTQPILVKDKYGICAIRPNDLLQKSNPSIKTALNKTEYCINKFKEIWKDRWDYSKFEYLGARVKGTIICKIHGEFTQDANMHLSGRCGCPLCGRSQRGLVRRSSTEEFIDKSIAVHGEKYDYSKANYIHAKDKLLISCTVEGHEDFLQTPNDHLTGYGCPACGLVNGGFSRSQFITTAKGRVCTLYLILCFDGEESFYKIGITSKSVKHRFGRVVRMPYQFNTLMEYKSKAEIIWNLEKTCHREFRRYSYTPKKYFEGYTECFTLDVPIEDIKNMFKSIEESK